MLFRRKKKLEIDEVPIVAGAEHYRPGLYYYAGARAGISGDWRGPKYWNGTRWRSDLLEVLAQIRAVVQTNANLPAGLQAAAREHRRQLHHWTQRRIGLFFRTFIIPILLLFLFLGLIGFGNFGEATPVGYLFLIAAIISVGYGAMAFYYAGKVEAVLLKVRDDLESGRQLSESMRRMNRFFPPICADLVATGEATGQLGSALNSITDDLLESSRHRAGLGKYIYYFVTIGLIQALLITFVSIKVFPVFAEIVEEFGADQPWSMKLFYGVVDPVQYALMGGSATVILILQAIVCLSIVRWVWRHFSTRPRGAFWLRVPFVSRSVRAKNLSAIGKLLAALLRAGMPLPEALGRVAACHLGPPYQKALQQVREKIENGAPLAEALDAQKRLFPEGFRAFVQLGEHAGRLPETLEQTAAHYQRSHELTLHYCRALLAPMGILLLGCVNLAVTYTAFDLLTTMTYSIMADL